jgi:hypothetical protein
MQKGTKVIWDSKDGYELGYFVKPVTDKMAFVLTVTGHFKNKTTLYPKTELFKYTNELHNEMIAKYGYKHTF